MARSRSANVVPCAITNMLRSFASRVMTSCASASATPPRLSGFGGAIDEGHHRRWKAGARDEGYRVEYRATSVVFSA
jgi:hypothetical protein